MSDTTYRISHVHDVGEGTVEIDIFEQKDGKESLIIHDVAKGKDAEAILQMIDKMRDKKCQS